MAKHGKKLGDGRLAHETTLVYVAARDRSMRSMMRDVESASSTSGMMTTRAPDLPTATSCSRFAKSWLRNTTWTGKASADGGEIGEPVLNVRETNVLERVDDHRALPLGENWATRTLSLLHVTVAVDPHDEQITESPALLQIAEMEVVQKIEGTGGEPDDTAGLARIEYGCAQRCRGSSRR